MNDDNEIVQEIHVSDNFTSVFFTVKEARQFLDSLLNPDGSPPQGLNIMFIRRVLLSPKTKGEIRTATPEKLKEWVGYKD